MGKQAGRIIFSLFLIALGVVVLLSNLHVLAIDINNNQLFWSAAFAVGGLAFLAAYISNFKENWWALIPGFTLLGIAALIGLPFFQGVYGGAMFLGMIGLSFWVIYFTRREFWWAVIPGGVLLTLAGVTLISGADNGFGAGGFFFLGLALTFLLVYYLPTAYGRMRWAIWPAGVLGIMGALIMTGASGLARFVWPAVLIVIGGLLVMRAMRPRAQ